MVLKGLVKHNVAAVIMGLVRHFSALKKVFEPEDVAKPTQYMSTSYTNHLTHEGPGSATYPAM